jgi:hypothetical protein
VNFTPAIFACTLASLIYLAGCAVQKEWTATGGSRADGTVELAFEYGVFEKPRVDNAQGVDLAASMCAGWGYTGSQPFGAMTKCEASDAYGNCLRTLVTRKYQCLGAPGSSVAPQRSPLASSAVQSNPAQPQTDLKVNTTGAADSVQRTPAAQGASSAPGNATAAPDPSAGDQWHEVDQ